MIDSALERARPWLEAALCALNDKRPLYSMADVESALAVNRARLWSGERSCVLTAVDDYPTGERVLDVWLAGGDLAEMTTVFPIIEAWACGAGCTQVHITGRPGWDRVMRDYGFEYYATQLRKVLA